MPYLHVSFDDVVAHPLQTAAAICNFLDISLPDDEAIQEWIEPKLVNRDKLPPKKAKGRKRNPSLLTRAYHKLRRILKLS